MTDLHGIQPAMAPNAVEAANPVLPSSAPSETFGISDVVEISAAAKLAAKVAEIPDVRVQLVETVKAEIAAGVYETPERLDIAVARLTEELFGNM